MTLTIKDISLTLVFSVIYSIVAVWLVGITAAIAYPNWMQDLIAETTTSDKNVRAIYMFIWEFLVVHFVGAGIPFILVLSGLLWALKKISYRIAGSVITIYLATSLFFIPLFYGDYIPFSFTFYLLLQPLVLILCAVSAITYFKNRPINENVQ